MNWLMTVDMTVRSPKFDFIEIDPSQAFKDRSGRIMQKGIRFDGNIPSNLAARQQGTKKLCDVFHILGFICVNATFRDIVESLEPNAHQFFPIALEAKDGTPYSEQYFIFNPCGVVDAYVGVGDDTNWGLLPNIGLPYRKGFEDVALSSDEIGRRHVWVGGFMGAGDIFISDVLHKKLEKATIRYLWCRQLPKVSNAVWHPEEQMPRVVRWLEADPARIRDLIERRPEWVRRHRPDWLQ